MRALKNYITSQAEYFGVSGLLSVPMSMLPTHCPKNLFEPAKHSLSILKSLILHDIQYCTVQYL
jgi:hypothetical protein